MLWYLRNVHDKMADGETAFEKRSGQTFYGPSIPSRTLSEYLEEQAVWQENDEWDMFRLCATCGRWLVRRLDGRRLREICKYQKRQTPMTRINYFKVIVDARLELEKDSAPAVPCFEKNGSRLKPQAGATSMDANDEQSDSANRATYGKVKRQPMEHGSEKDMWEACTMTWHACQFQFNML